MSLFSNGELTEEFEVPYRFTEEDFNNFLIWGTANKISDFTFQTNEPPIVETGGNLIRLGTRNLTASEIDDMVKMIYGENGPSEIKSGYDIDPGYEIRVPKEGRVRFRVNVTGGRSRGGGDGCQITIRTFPDIPPSFKDLGVEKGIIDNYYQEHGLVMVTGGTGNGKSTLMAAGTRYILEHPEISKKILEYSQPIEFTFDKIQSKGSLLFASEVGKHLRPRLDNRIEAERMAFEHAVRNSLRRHPGVIILGEARDQWTISAAIKAAQTGHGLYSTMHTDDCAKTFSRAVSVFPAAERHSTAIDIIESLKLVVSQQLIKSEKGGKVALREYIVVDGDVRDYMITKDWSEWGGIVRKLLDSDQVTGQSFAAHAKIRLEEGQISEKTYQSILAKSKTENKNFDFTQD